MVTTYKLASDKLDGHLLASYEDGQLKRFEIDVKTPLTDQQFEVFKSVIPKDESGISAFDAIRLHVVEITAAPEKTNEKLALWCELWMEFNAGKKYKVIGPESKKMAELDVDEKLLRHYFATQLWVVNGKRSISNLYKYFNEVRADYWNKAKPKFINHYDAFYASKLAGSDISLYYAHLRGLGLKPRRDQQQNIVDWI